MEMIENKRNHPDALLEVNDLEVQFFTPQGIVKAVNGISYYINPNEVIAFVGESGCGKSVSQMATIQLIQSPPGKITGGEVLYKGINLLAYGTNSPEIHDVRGAEISMVFQEPMTSLNPIFTVGSQIVDVIRTHRKVSKKEARSIAKKALKDVGIPDPDKRMNSYPFEMSGGMRQRVLIAIAIACQSELIIADEPTTALDVTTQAQVMELLLQIVREKKKSLVVVTHNLGLVSRYADRIYVMYAGRIVESGTTEEILAHPKHPYTKGLLHSVPRLDDDKKEELKPIEGAPPSLLNIQDTCAFAPRCPYYSDRCKHVHFPPLVKVDGESESHFVACFLEGNIS